MKNSDGPPEGWAVGHASICSIDCMRELYSGLAIAHIFPAHATDEEHAALRAHEDKFMRGVLDCNPTMLGKIAGSLFAQREERQRLRELASPKQSS
jgi:hypothetical protein